MLFFLFLFGLSVGSFLNVLIDRLPKDESILGRSHCDHCNHKLSWYDLIPLLSFVFLQRQCRYCHKKISWQYPLVEFITGILFVFTYTSVIQITKAELFLPTLVFYSLVISGLITIFFTDFKYRIIPDQIIAFLSFASIVYLIFYQRQDFFNHFISALVLFLTFLFLVVITRGKGMGVGDVKFAFAIGMILGFPEVLAAFYLSFLTGAVISLILVIRGKKTMKSTIPFGPFLA
ncbi:prepilin peptidase, partial [Candidatus Roizmanbacteria bacterium]|nr:prepilin peptidase [Candidatus Roizmanbacteria bacterium]